jgi:hypothetical protein
MRIPSLLQKIFARPVRADRESPGAITPEQVREMLAWAHKNARVAVMTRLPGVTGWPAKMMFNAVPEDVTIDRKGKGLKAEVVHMPANLVWYEMPIFVYVCLIDDRVEYRFSKTSQAVYDAPVLRERRAIRKIEEVFALWFQYMKALEALKTYDEAAAVKKPRPEIRPTPTNQAPDTSDLDHIEVIHRYLAGGDTALPYEALAERKDVLFWVDWRADDQEIVQECEALIKSGNLSAEWVPNAVSADLDITYKGKVTRVPYPPPGADRDTTLFTLARVLAGDFDLRLWTDSNGSDMAAFAALTSDEWRQLEASFGDIVAVKFAPLQDLNCLFDDKWPKAKVMQKLDKG